MCGIAGIIDIDQRGRVCQEHLQRMVNAISHRGPDGQSMYIDKHVAFGFSRLSIVDLQDGMQPMLNEDKSVVSMCNGEVFNYRQLRAQLQSNGHTFLTQCDAEVIPHLYEHAGEGLWNELNGQFAIAIYDQKRKVVLLARDHFGISPLHYAVVDGLLLFASEIKALLAHPLMPRPAVDLIGLDQILSFPGLISPRTAFQGIHSLRAGHYLETRLGQTPVEREYWDLDFTPFSDSEIPSSDQCAAEVMNLLKESVRLRLQADVPVGFYVSGGLDSSLIVALAKQLAPNEAFHSFGIHFEERLLSEESHQSKIAKAFQLRHSSEQFNCDKICDRLRRVIRHCECPLKESFDTAALTLSELAQANGVSVVLAGQGADELFGGYIGYRFDQFRNSRRTDTGQTVEEALISRQLWGDENFFYETKHHALLAIRRRLYSRQVHEQIDGMPDCLKHLPIDRSRLVALDAFHKRSYLDCKLRLSDHLLSDHGDRMTFANSVEGRYPFLDLNLVRYVSRLPSRLHLNGFEEKTILKKLATPLLPQAIVRREKFGFTSPGSADLLRSQNPLVLDYLNIDRIGREGYFNPEWVAELKIKYSEPGFRVNVPFEQDWLMLVITFGIFLEEFGLPSLS
jgi:asparagine synthase (glutamine-hydrolysing)